MAYGLGFGLGFGLGLKSCSSLVSGMSRVTACPTSAADVSESETADHADPAVITCDDPAVTQSCGKYVRQPPPPSISSSLSPLYTLLPLDRKSTRLYSSYKHRSRMPTSAL